MVSVFILLLAPLFAGADEQSFASAYRAGLVALQANDLATAKSNLEHAAKLAPSHPGVWAALADVYLKAGRRTEADGAASKAEALGPGDPIIQHTLALYYSQTARPLKAAEFESKYAAAGSADRDAWQRAAEWYFAAAEPLLKQQKFAEALVILEPAATKIPSDAQLQLALGVADYGLRRFDDAAEQFLKCIELAPDARQPYVFLGKMLDQAPQQLPKIAPRFAAWRKAHPDDELGYLLEAKALDAQNENPETARTLLEKAVALAPSDPAAHAELGILEERLQHFEAAARELERAAALDASDPATHYHLARVYDRLGQPERARAERQTHQNLIAAQETVR